MSSHSTGPGPRLTELDKVFLQLDARRRPMHWALVFELANAGEPVRAADLRARVAERAGRYDVFQLAVANGGWRKPRLTRPANWSPGDNVEFHSIADESGTAAYLANLMARPLPTGIPPWQVSLVDQASPHRQLLVLRVHHCLSDGIAGAGFATLFADGGPRQLAEFDRFLATDRFQLERIGGRRGSRAIRALAANWREGRDEVRWPRISRERRRQVDLLSVPTAVIRKRAAQCSASTHELVLSAVGAAIGSSPPGPGPGPRVARALLPITLDPLLRHTGNAVTMALINLPCGAPTTREGVAAVRSQLRDIAACRSELAIPALGRTVGRLPWQLQKGAAAATMSLLRPTLHIGVNPGFSKVRSIFGHAIERVYPLSPLAGNPLSVTVLFLGGVVTFGIVSDPLAIPGYGPQLAVHLRQSLEGRPENVESAPGQG